jgi:hypothetical protein
MAISTASTSRAIFHLAQRLHDLNRLGLTHKLLDIGILDAHEDVVFLGKISITCMSARPRPTTYLLITNREFTLRLLVRLGVLVQLLDCIVVEHLLCKANVALRVLVTGKHFRVVGKRSKRLVQGLVHLRGIALEEAAAAANEERVAGEDSAVGAILEEERDAILGVAGCVECCYFDIANAELRLVLWGGRDLGAVLATNDRQFVVLKLVLLDLDALQLAFSHNLRIPSSVVVVAVYLLDMESAPCASGLTGGC